VDDADYGLKAIRAGDAGKIDSKTDSKISVSAHGAESSHLVEIDGHD
jgi:hypothetical protein